MATPVIMPRQGQSVESCIITKWHKNVGEEVKVGDILFSYETDKASFEEEASVAGVMLDIFFEEDDDVPCLINVCVIGEEGESTAEFNPNQQESGLSEADAADAAEHVATQEQQVQTQTNDVPLQKDYTADDMTTEVLADGEMIKISPRAKSMARKAGIDYRYAKASGPYGRIIENDILELKKSGPIFTISAIEEQMKNETGMPIKGTGIGGRITADDLSAGAEVKMAEHADIASLKEPIYEDVKLSNIRKVIAKTMHQSLSTMAQLTLNSSFDATNIITFRKKVKENQELLGLGNITINDIIIYAASRTLLNHKEVNAHFLDDRIRHFKNVNMGVAVDTERGLMVPTLFNANLKSLNDISAETKRLVKECRTGAINPDHLTNGSFTITNLGTLDIESFTPVINPPQTGILGVDNIVQRAREVNGEIKLYPAMGLSLTFDHRALDGATAARFLKELKTNLESFTVLLAK